MLGPFDYSKYNDRAPGLEEEEGDGSNRGSTFDN